MASDTEIKKAMVALAIEKSLREFSDTVLEVVSNRLKQDYNVYLPDCYEHPEYLKQNFKRSFWWCPLNYNKFNSKTFERFYKSKTNKRIFGKD